MTQFVVEYRIRNQAGDPAVLPSLNTVNAENLQMVQRDVERVLASGSIDEAVIYAPVRVVKASRLVSTSTVTGVTGLPMEGSAQ